MAPIIPHPTLLQSPSHIQAFQHRHGVLIVLSARGPMVIPALHLRAPRIAIPLSGTFGGDAA